MCLLMSPWLEGIGDYSPHYDVKFDLIFIWFDYRERRDFNYAKARNSRQLPEYFAELFYNSKQYQPFRWNSSIISHTEKLAIYKFSGLLFYSNIEWEGHKKMNSSIITKIRVKPNTFKVTD